MAVSPALRPVVAADSPRLAFVHLRSWQTAYRGLLPDAYLAELGTPAALSARIEKWTSILGGESDQGARTMAIAVDGVGIVGFASAGPIRDGVVGCAGEIYAIYLLAEYRGQGLGARLFARAVDHLRMLGLDSCMLWMLETNPSAAFYRAMGGVLDAGLERRQEVGGQAVRDVAFGWRPLPAARPS